MDTAKATAEPDSGIQSAVITPVNAEESSLPTMADKSEPTPSNVIVSSSSKDKQNEDENLDEVEETLYERLVGLTEMFPEPVVNAVSSLTSKSVSLLQESYSLARILVWFSSTSSLILFGPVLFEVERLNTQEMIKQDRNKLVLGPGTAMSGPPPGAYPSK